MQRKRLLVLGVVIAAAVALAATTIALASGPTSAVNPSNSGGMMGGGMMGGGTSGGMMGGTANLDAMGQMMGRALAGRAGQPISPSEAGTLGDAVPAGVTVDRTANRLTFTTPSVRLAVLASPSNGPDMTFRIAGLADPTIVVPQGASITVQFVNADSDTSHGWLLTTAQPPFGPMAMMGAPAVAGAFAPPLGDPTAAGLPTETITFTAATAGHDTYLCPVPGHAQQGMYGTLEVIGA